MRLHSFGRSKFWLLIVDDATDYCWSYFLKTKKQLSQEVRNLIKEIKKRDNKDVKYIRLDNAGENKKLERDCKNDGLGIKFEWTAPGTPQQNGRVERKFTTLYGQMRVMFLESRLTEEMKKGLWTKGAATATILEI